MSRARCVSCSKLLQRESDVDRLVCVDCQATVQRHLRELGGERGLYATLLNMGADALQPVKGGRTERVGSRVEAPMPLNVRAIDLTSATADGVLGRLKFWVEEWFRDPQLMFTPPAWSGAVLSLRDPQGRLIKGQLDRAVEALTVNVSWAVEHRQDFGKFGKDLLYLVVQCKRIIDPADPEASPVPRVMVGHCPTLIEDGRCGAVLAVRLGATGIKCSRCGTVWPMSRWPELAAGVV